MTLNETNDIILSKGFKISYKSEHIIEYSFETINGCLFITNTKALFSAKTGLDSTNKHLRQFEKVHLLATFKYTVIPHNVNMMRIDRINHNNPTKLEINSILDDYIQQLQNYLKIQKKIKILLKKQEIESDFK